MNARRAALLGLNAPLSPIMLAVLGIWPEDEEEPPAYTPPFEQFLGGRARKIAFEDLQDDEPAQVDTKRFKAMMLVIVAAAEELLG